MQIGELIAILEAFDPQLEVRMEFWGEQTIEDAYVPTQGAKRVLIRANEDA